MRTSTTNTLENAQAEQNLYYYHPDHLGSTSLITNLDGEIVQNVAYIPYGEFFIEERNGSYSTSYLFNAKELDSETGLYYYGARYLDPSDAMWLSVDPLWEKYVGTSPYAYCHNNPIMMVDPDGKKVRPKGNEELEMIQNTLTEDDAKFVVLDENGFIDKNLINSHKSKSGNYNSLVDLVNSDIIVDVILDVKYTYRDKNGELKFYNNMKYFPFDPIYDNENDKDINGLTMSDLSTGESGFFGKTLFPDTKGLENSYNQNIIVIINKNLSKKGAAETYSHEENGHALLYIKNGNDHFGASHNPNGLKEQNLILLNMIVKSKQETVLNMKNRKK